MKAFTIGMCGALLSLGNIAQAGTWTVTNLHPSGYTDSFCSGVSGGQQVGGAKGEATGGNLHAFLWTGSPESAVDLHPIGYETSYAYECDSGQQVGDVYRWAFDYGSTYAAALWNDTAASIRILPPNPIFGGDTGARNIDGSSVVGAGGRYNWGLAAGEEAHATLWNESGVTDLTPPRIFPGVTPFSVAYGIDSGQQAGMFHGLLDLHACVWSGTAASCVDINPSWAATSGAYDCSAGQQIGYAARSDGLRHAVLWQGTSASAVDLNPVGCQTSFGYKISHGWQAGWAKTTAGSTDHAGVWRGTAASWFDLQQLLPSYYSRSYAECIDASDTDVWVGGYAYNTVAGRTEAILWHYTIRTGEAKLRPNNSVVNIGEVIVTAIFSDCFYVESLDRSYGIRVVSSGPAPPQGKVVFSGALKTSETGERYVETSSVQSSGSGSLMPLGLPNQTLGGGDWHYNPATGAGQKGVVGGYGLNNIGLLVRTYGKVTYLDPAQTFGYIDDGSGRSDGNTLGANGNAIKGVRVAFTSGVALPAASLDTPVIITGISGMELLNGTPVSVLRLRGQGDIVVLP